MATEQIPITPRCPMRTTLELISGKWRLLIVKHLEKEPLRFSELKDCIPGISDKMLNQELQILQESQLAERIVSDPEGQHVTYQLTQMGNDLKPVIEEMTRFGLSYQEYLFGK